MIKEIVATFLFLNFKMDKQTPHLNTNSCLEFKKFHGKREKMMYRVAQIKDALQIHLN